MANPDRLCIFSKHIMGLSKLVMSPRRPPASSTGAIQKRWNNIRAIWNNEYDDDNGIEKMVRLFLAASLFLFPGLYIKEFFSRNLNYYEDLAIDVYVLFKIILPGVIVYHGWSQYPWIVGLNMYLMSETLLYVPALVFASDKIGRPRSYRRSMLLLFLNYVEIILGFAVIYSTGGLLNTHFEHWFDPVYFSFMTASTIGYGDMHPVTTLGKAVVSGQSILFIMYLYLFLNFFTSRVQAKGYFGAD